MSTPKCIKYIFSLLIVLLCSKVGVDNCYISENLSAQIAQADAKKYIIPFAVLDDEQDIVVFIFRQIQSQSLFIKKNMTSIYSHFIHESGVLKHANNTKIKGYNPISFKSFHCSIWEMLFPFNYFW